MYDPNNHDSKQQKPILGYFIPIEESQNQYPSGYQNNATLPQDGQYIQFIKNNPNQYLYHPPSPYQYNQILPYNNGFKNYTEALSPKSNFIIQYEPKSCSAFYKIMSADIDYIDNTGIIIHLLMGDNTKQIDFYRWDNYNSNDKIDSIGFFVKERIELLRPRAFFNPAGNIIDNIEKTAILDYRINFVHNNPVENVYNIIIDIEPVSVLHSSDIFGKRNDDSTFSIEWVPDSVISYIGYQIINYAEMFGIIKKISMQDLYIGSSNVEVSKILKDSIGSLSELPDTITIDDETIKCYKYTKFISFDSSNLA